jgi:hypothetical protein
LPPEKYSRSDFFGNGTQFVSRVFERPLPRNAQKHTQKIKARTFFFLRAGADARRFPVLFVLPPLETTEAKKVTRPSIKHCFGFLFAGVFGLLSLADKRPKT